jgi:hypothetical protein
VRAILDRFRHEAHDLVERLRAVPDAAPALPALTEAVWSLHERLRASCEELLRLRAAAAGCEVADGRRLKHLLLERISSAGAILESGEEEQEEAADEEARARIARDAAAASADMLEHFLDMLASVEHAWGL